MISRQRRAWPYGSAGGSAPSGITGAVPAHVDVLAGDGRRASSRRALSIGMAELMSRRSIAHSIARRGGSAADRRVAGAARGGGRRARGRRRRDARRRGARVPLGVGHEAGDGARRARRGGGGRRRPRRAGRAGGLDGAAPAGPRVRASVRVRQAPRSRRPGARRIYSNAGFEELAEHVAQAAAEMPFGDYLRAAVLEPLGMTRSELRGSAGGRPVGAARRPAPARRASCWRRR